MKGCRNEARVCENQVLLLQRIPSGFTWEVERFYIRFRNIDEIFCAMTLSSDLVKPLPICPNRERSGPPNTSKSSATGGYLMIWRVSPCCAWISAGLAAISAGLARSQPVSLPSPLEDPPPVWGVKRLRALRALRLPQLREPERRAPHGCGLAYRLGVDGTRTGPCGVSTST